MNYNKTVVETIENGVSGKTPFDIPVEIQKDVTLFDRVELAKRGIRIRHNKSLMPVTAEKINQ